jgi:hypothetical protein
MMGFTNVLVLLSLGSPLLLEYFLWVMGSAGGAGKLLAREQATMPHYLKVATPIYYAARVARVASW